ncbi:hypothetical protein V5O48_017388 [Marasmius crinis-equi]|uniref:Uncharacterized protein n=1 Tax=Marasmius crinis-equi TaxID=585013 RepID=A0ABR3EPC3_9AGAR
MGRALVYTYATQTPSKQNPSSSNGKQVAQSPLVKFSQNWNKTAVKEVENAIADAQINILRIKLSHGKKLATALTQIKAQGRKLETLETGMTKAQEKKLEVLEVGMKEAVSRADTLIECINSAQDAILRLESAQKDDQRRREAERQEDRKQIRELLQRLQGGEERPHKWAYMSEGAWCEHMMVEIPGLMDDGEGDAMEVDGKTAQLPP